MPQRRRGARILGPYPHHDGWRCIQVAEDGSRRRRFFDTEEEANLYVQLFQEQLAAGDRTTATALSEYEKHLKEQGNLVGSISRTRWSISVFFPKPIPLWALSERRCKELYADLTERNRHADKPDKEPETYSVDSHRNALAEVKTFLGWCVEQRWITTNPAAKVKGTGRRRKRKPQLRIKQARKWYGKALELAEVGDDGAVAALVALLLGLRASEITNLVVGDLDETDTPCDTVWIDDSKTDAGRRALEVPEVLRLLLVEQAKGMPPARPLFAGAKGRPHWRDWVRKNVKRIAAAAELPEDVASALTAHSLRGMLADLALRRGAPGELVAGALGHEDPRTTREAYAQAGAAEEGDRRKGLKVLAGGRGRE
jgi:integrase